MINEAQEMLDQLEGLGPDRDYSQLQSKDKKAKFSTPEALVTAIGAGAILGPVGGVLLGAAQGILGKRADQKILDRLAEEQNALSDVNQIFDDEFDRLSLTANDFDKEQLGTLRSMKDAAMRMSTSQSPVLQMQGAKMLEQFYAGLEQYTVRQETQMIESEVRDAEAKRALGQEGYTRYKDSRDNFMKESAQYIEVKSATTNILNAIARGTPVDMYAAAKLMDKALDTGSVVRPEEAEAWGQLGSMWERGSVFMNKLRSGETLGGTTMAQMRDLALSIESQSYKLQLEREARYYDEITDIELPEKYHNNFRIARPLGVGSAGGSAATASPDDEAGVMEALAAVGIAAGDTVSAIPPEVKAGLAAAGGVTAANWAPKLTKVAAKFGIPLAAVLAAGEQLPGETDEAYRRRLRRGMESTEYDERRRPTN